MVSPQQLRFVVRSITFTLTPTGYSVTCYTNNPCHLFFRYTTTRPVKHINQRIVRGAQVGTYIDQCFVAFKDIEQEEAGDTYTHTFIIEPWPVCQTRWFYFWGTVQGELSPSASAIFSKHRGHDLVIAYFYPAQYHGYDSVDGRVTRALAHKTWNNLHDGDGTTYSDTSQTSEIRIRSSHHENKWLNITRTIFTFPTSSIPPSAVILQANIRIYVLGKNPFINWAPSAAVFQSHPVQYNALSLADYQNIDDIPLSDIEFYASIPINDHTTFPFNALGLATIQKGAVTELALREASYDAPHSPPEWQASTNAGLWFWTADYGPLYLAPRLEVQYKV